MMKTLGWLIMALLITMAGCRASESQSTGDSTRSGAQPGLKERFEQTHPDYADSIAICGISEDETLLLFLDKRGGTFLFRKSTDKVQSVNHAKVIVPSMITKITYSEKNASFTLWAGENKALTIGVSK